MDNKINKNFSYSSNMKNYHTQNTTNNIVRVNNYANKNITTVEELDFNVKKSSATEVIGDLVEDVLIGDEKKSAKEQIAMELDKYHFSQKYKDDLTEVIFDVLKKHSSEYNSSTGEYDMDELLYHIDEILKEMDKKKIPAKPFIVAVLNENYPDLQINISNENFEVLSDFLTSKVDNLLDDDKKISVLDAFVQLSDMEGQPLNVQLAYIENIFTVIDSLETNKKINMDDILTMFPNLKDILQNTMDNIFEQNDISMPVFGSNILVNSIIECDRGKFYSFIINRLYPGLNANISSHRASKIIKLLNSRRATENCTYYDKLEKIIKKEDSLTKVADLIEFLQEFSDKIPYSYNMLISDFPGLEDKLITAISDKFSEYGISFDSSNKKAFGYLMTGLLDDDSSDIYDGLIELCPNLLEDVLKKFNINGSFDSKALLKKISKNLPDLLCTIDDLLDLDSYDFNSYNDCSSYVSTISSFCKYTGLSTSLFSGFINGLIK